MDGRAWAVAWIVAIAGCTPEPPDAERSEPALDEVAPEPVAPEPVAPVVLDSRDGARLIGRAEPLIANADPEPVFTLRGTEGVAGLEGARVLEARFVGDAVVTIDVQHVLRVHGRAVREVDRGAYGPLSIVGDTIAYVRGHAPSLEVARADVSSGEVLQLTEDMAPSWLPALSPDRESVVFVSGASGRPRLYRADGASVRALPQSERLPTARRAPRFEEELLVFEDYLGVAWLDLETGRVVRTEVAR